MSDVWYLKRWFLKSDDRNQISEIRVQKTFEKPESCRANRGKYEATDYDVWQGAILGDIWFKYVIIGAFLGLCDKKVTLKQECQGILDLDSSSNPTLQLST